MENSHRKLADELSLNHGFSSGPALNVVAVGVLPFKAALPQNDLDRLNALYWYGILDAPPDAAVGHITEIAVAFFRLPITIVSLADNDRRWFKSQRAIDSQVEPARD